VTHIAQVANFYSPTSGGLRTAVEALGRGYQSAGLERTLVVPGPHRSIDYSAAGRRVTIPGRPLPGSPYRVFAGTHSLLSVLDGLEPDRIEVHDKLHARAVAQWANRRGVPAVLVSHERLDGILAARLPGWFPLPATADAWNGRLVAAFDQIVCSSRYAAVELERVGGRPQVIPLGVDLDVFHPSAGAPSCDRYVVMAGRLSSEKRPDLSIAAFATAHALGLAARLVVVGAGRSESALRRQAAGLPVTFAGHVSHRGSMAALLAGASALVAPCPVETFGLAVLEALACGTPAVVPAAGAAPELVTTGCGLVVAPEVDAFAAGLVELLGPTSPASRARARARAEAHPWSATVGSILALHGLETLSC